MTPILLYLHIWVYPFNSYRTEIITQPVNQVDVVGTGSTTELMAQAKTFAQEYFTSYKANDWTTVISMTYADDIDNHDIANANNLARTRIIEVGCR